MVKKTNEFSVEEKLKDAERDAAMRKAKYENLYKRWYVEKFDNLGPFEKEWAIRAYKLVNWKSPEAMTVPARNRFKVKYMEEKEWVRESIYWNKKSWWSKVNEELIWIKNDKDFDDLDEVIEDIIWIDDKDLPFN